jgi:hypothetical protein
MTAVILKETVQASEELLETLVFGERRPGQTDGFLLEGTICDLRAYHI